MRQRRDGADEEDPEYGEQAVPWLRRRFHGYGHRVVLICAKRWVDVRGAGIPGDHTGDPGEEDDLEPADGIG